MTTQIKRHRQNIPQYKAPKTEKPGRNKGVKLLAGRGKTRLIPQKNTV